MNDKNGDIFLPTGPREPHGRTYLEQLHSNRGRFKYSAALITGRCVICNEDYSFSWYDWKTHFLEHTDEKRFYCFECNTQLFDKTNHINCPPESIIDIFGDQDMGCALDGFLCQLCDHFQINDYRAMKHLEQEHDELCSLFEIHVARITLVPDVRPAEHIIQTDFVYVPQKERYRCGIGNCTLVGKNLIEYTEHFRKAHTIIKTYFCPHCHLLMNRLNQVSVEHERILQHIEYHGEELHQCVSCDLVTASETAIRSHISSEHRELPIKFWRNKRQAIETADSELVDIVLDCILCGERVNTIQSVLAHFKDAHQSYEIDFRAVKLVKTTTQDLDVICSVDDSTLHFREVLLCGLCDKHFPDKHKWLMHFTEAHPSDGLALKRNLKWCESYERSKVIDFDRNMLFYCTFCETSDGIKSIGNSTIEGVYEHWKQQHRPFDSKPFQFYVTEFVACNYCNVMSTFQGLKQHVVEQHPGKAFVPIKAFEDEKQCALCEYNFDDLAEHYRTMHSLENQSNVFNPIKLTDENLQNLLRIWVHQKIICEHCNEVFDTREQYRTHHNNEHTKLERNSRAFFDKDSIQLVGDCCHTPIDPSSFYDHLEDHEFALNCKLCPFSSIHPFHFMRHKVEVHEDQESLADLYHNFLRLRYWRSELIFGNGLILNKFNTQGTDFDYTKNFEAFVSRLVTDKIREFEETKGSQRSLEHSA